MLAPAICDTCGSVFPSAFDFENTTSVTFSGCGSGPCPNCGGMGHIPDGIYNFLDNTLHLLAGPTRTINELERLANLLKDAKEKRHSPDEIKKALTDEVPELSSLSDLLPKTRNELYAFLSMVLAIISIILTLKPGSEAGKIQINQVVNYIYQQQAPLGASSVQSFQKKPVHMKNQVSSQHKIGRNDPCTCGSGKKYKKCCLP